MARNPNTPKMFQNLEKAEVEYFKVTEHEGDHRGFKKNYE